MSEKRRPYKSYPEAFKLEALRLLESSGRPASEIARELGIGRNQLGVRKGDRSIFGVSYESSV